MRTLALFLLGTLVAACDSSNDYENCRYSETFNEPRGARCPGSIFPKDDERSREIVGVVFRGDAPVPNAVVRMEPRPQPTGSASSYSSLTTVSDSAGFYRVKNVPFEYDLTVRLGNDVLTYRDLSFRYFEPTFAIAELPRTWTSGVDVVIVPPLKAGHVITFVGSGDAVISVTGDAVSGAVVATKEYTGVATIHAIEHPEGTLIDRATSYGKVEVNVQAGRRTTAQVQLGIVDRYDEVTFSAPLPERFKLDGDIDVWIDFGPRTNVMHYAVARPDVLIKLPIFPSANGAYVSATAHRGAAASTTGLYPMPARQGPIVLPFPEPPRIEPAVSGGDFVAAAGKGVIEHVLRPAGGASGPTLHVITADLEGRLPELESLGFPRPSGRWVWTARDFPKVERVDRLRRPDWLIQPSATTEPTEIFLP